MTYGGIYGLAVMAFLLIMYFVGTDMQSRLPNLVQYVIQIIAIVLAVKSFRDHDLGGYIKYGRAVGTGVLTSLFGGLLISGFTVLLMYYIAPEMIDMIMSKAREQLEARGDMTEAQMEYGLSWTKKMMQPLPLFVFGIFGPVFVGFIMSLIVCVFLKREDSNPFSNINQG